MTMMTTKTETILRSASHLRGYGLAAKDGSIGRIDDTYFDDQHWCLRYFVADTGNWLNKRLVLIAPVACGHPDWDKKSIPVDLSRDQVANSPEADLAKPVSKRYEVDLHAYYGWPLPWPTESDQPEDAGPLGNSHLRSTREVTSYAIKATDGEIGHVEDFIVEDRTWIIRYMVIDTRNWLPGRKVLVAPTWIASVDWPEGQVTVDLTRDAIRNGPRFDPAEPVNRAYESQLYDYYGRPRYW